MGDKVGDKVGDKNSHLTQTQASILAEIRNNPDITKPELAEKLKLGKTTVDKGITVLKQRGFIERVGSNKSGYWKAL